MISAWRRKTARAENANRCSFQLLNVEVQTLWFRLSIKPECGNGEVLSRASVGRIHGED